LICFCLFLFATMLVFASDNILIKGGMVYDGTSNDPVPADVLICGQKIMAVGNSAKFRGEEAKAAKKAKVMDAAGLVVAPGFIDPHSHVNAGLAKTKTKEGKGYLRMGVTTVLCGVCGSSPVPVSGQADILSEKGSGLNVGYFVGLGSVRKKVLGSSNRVPSDDELVKMKSLVREGMEWGAFGVSSGLIYVPGMYAKTDELIELTAVASEYGGIYTSHMRNEGEKIRDGVAEALKIGRETGADVNISHIKCAGKAVHGASSEIIAAIEDAQKSGMHITADQYPYKASSTTLSATVLPAWARQDKKGRNEIFDDPQKFAKVKKYLEKKIGSYDRGDRIVIAPTTKDKSLAGKSLSQIAKEWDMTTVDAVVKIFRTSSPSVINYSMCEEDIRNFMVQPWVMTGTDGNATGGHPRSRGTYARKIRKYVFEEHIITLLEMIRRSTGLVADTYGIANRGYLKKGYWADVIVFDPAAVRDNNSFEKPLEYSTGFRAVFVNGQLAVDSDVATGALAGMIVKRDNSAKVR